MSEMTTALKTAKELERNLVQHENRLAFTQDEVKRLTATKDSLQDEIAKKSADYDLYIGKRDADSKKMRQSILDEQTKLDASKHEFQTLLAAFAKERQAHMESIQGADNEKKKIERQQNDVRQFIIAVQRASSLLGL